MPMGLTARTSTSSRLRCSVRWTASTNLLRKPCSTVCCRTSCSRRRSATLRDVALPYLHELGERWERREITIAQEHFASNVIRGRLAGLARGWGVGRGPRAIVACPPDELHDLPLMIFGIVLNRGGWRVDYFGASTPVAELIEAAGRSHPELVVVAATAAERFEPILSDLTRLAAVAPLALAGAGATQRMADEIGARLLTGDPVTAAQHLAQEW